ncbi:hypothetical protein FB446DRAFT_813472 [Lentinula raphanica]|nr:hypothetical protein FB446DRAFT_813472 [Lentinula raphanica]
MSSFLPVSVMRRGLLREFAQPCFMHLDLALAPQTVTTRSRARLGGTHLLESTEDQILPDSPDNVFPSRAPTPLPPRSPVNDDENLGENLPRTPSPSPALTLFSQQETTTGGADSSSDSLPGLTPLSPCSCSDSSSDYIPEMTSRAPSHNGALLRNTSKLPATILVARPSIIHLDALRYMQEIYFKTKSITDVEEKKRITLDEGFTHDLAFDWIRTNRDHLLGLAWEDTVDEKGNIVSISPFWNTLFEKYARRFWDAEHAADRNGLRMGSGEGETPFQEFVDMYEAYNKRLRGTDHFFEDSQVKTQIQLGLTPDFTRHLTREKIDSKLPYAAWKEKVMEVARFFTPTIVQQKRSGPPDHYNGGRYQSRRTFADNNSAGSRPGSRESSRAPSRNSASSHLLGPMTDFIKDGLRERGGCYHCRECFSPHNARSCPTKFVHLDFECRPLDKADFKFADDRHRETNKPVSLNEILAAKFEREKRNTKRAANAVSSVVFADESNASGSVSGPSSSAVASVYGNLPIVHRASGAAVYDRYAQPASSVVGAFREGDSSVLASLVESDDSNNDEIIGGSNNVCALVSSDDCGPVSLPHLMWKAVIRGPLTGDPFMDECLLDDGCPFVLIRADIVDRLGLTRRRLPSPQTLDVAMNKDSKNKVVVDECCILTPEDVSQKWFSRPVKALIVPVLCAPVILGLPFLTRNRIIIDYSSRSVIAKDSGFDLLHADRFKFRAPRVQALPGHQ